MYFEPKLQINGYNMTELQIDGGIICNNPSMYAYQMARIYRGQDKLRLLSIGTGEHPFDGWKSTDDFNNAAFMASLSEFMMNIDVYTAHNYLKA